ncbi:hypothetical protein BLNAU_11334 [Blattamonas nauphoetae]|uniref:Uncharacterized protein n=1 Tax=Blattamonas nauphoetae TaxID=2049346 RepID=A0ABQ9XQS3_9EUKA|nr:hypothetical protein BLNAU_11334 [Blattamonas nauphoetae]
MNQCGSLLSLFLQAPRELQMEELNLFFATPFDRRSFLAVLRTYSAEHLHKQQGQINKLCLESINRLNSQNRTEQLTAASYLSTLIYHISRLTLRSFVSDFITLLCGFSRADEFFSSLFDTICSVFTRLQIHHPKPHQTGLSSMDQFKPPHQFNGPLQPQFPHPGEASTLTLPPSSSSKPALNNELVAKKLLEEKETEAIKIESLRILYHLLNAHPQIEKNGLIEYFTGHEMQISSICTSLLHHPPGTPLCDLSIEILSLLFSTTSGQPAPAVPALLAQSEITNVQTMVTAAIPPILESLSSCLSVFPLLSTPFEFTSSAMPATLLSHVLLFHSLAAHPAPLVSFIHSQLSSGTFNQSPITSKPQPAAPDSPFSMFLSYLTQFLSFLVLTPSFIPQPSTSSTSSLVRPSPLRFHSFRLLLSSIRPLFADNELLALLVSSSARIFTIIPHPPSASVWDSFVAQTKAFTHWIGSFLPQSSQRTNINSLLIGFMPSISFPSFTISSQNTARTSLNTSLASFVGIGSFICGVVEAIAHFLEGSVETDCVDLDIVFDSLSVCLFILHFCCRETTIVLPVCVEEHTTLSQNEIGGCWPVRKAPDHASESPEPDQDKARPGKALVIQHSSFQSLSTAVLHLLGFLVSVLEAGEFQTVMANPSFSHVESFVFHCIHLSLALISLLVTFHSLFLHPSHFITFLSHLSKSADFLDRLHSNQKTTHKTDIERLTVFLLNKISSSDPHAENTSLSDQNPAKPQNSQMTPRKLLQLTLPDPLVTPPYHMQQREHIFVRLFSKELIETVRKEDDSRFSIR